MLQAKPIRKWIIGFTATSLVVIAYLQITEINTLQAQPALRPGDVEIVLTPNDLANLFNAPDDRPAEEKCQTEASIAALKERRLPEPYGTPQAGRIGNAIGTSMSKSITKKRVYKSCMKREAAKSQTVQANKVLMKPSGPLRPLTHFRDCDDCPEMIVLPKGEFMYGYSDADRAFMKRLEGGIEQPVPPRKLITMDRVLAAGKYEVTIGQYRRCIIAGACSPPLENTIGSIFNKAAYRSTAQGKIPFYDDLPATNLNNKQIYDYVDWLSQKTGRKYKLPSWIEWQYAARAGTYQVYPWGNELTRNMAIIHDIDNRNKYFELQKYRIEGAVTAVGQFKPNAWGLFDVIGNAPEVVSDCADPVPPNDQILHRIDKCGRTLVGGSSLTTSFLGVGYARTQSSGGRLDEGFRIFSEI